MRFSVATAALHAWQGDDQASHHLLACSTMPLVHLAPLRGVAISRSQRQDMAHQSRACRTACSGSREALHRGRLIAW